MGYVSAAAALVLHCLFLHLSISLHSEHGTDPVQGHLQEDRENTICKKTEYTASRATEKPSHMITTKYIYFLLANSHATVSN